MKVKQEIISFEDVPINRFFTFGELDYMKVSNDKGLSLAGGRSFNLQERVVFPIITN